MMILGFRRRGHQSYIPPLCVCESVCVCGRCHACHAKRNTKLCVTKLCVRELMQRKRNVDVAKCHACHAKRRWMSPSATPATQSAAASLATSRAQARHHSQPSASATPATQIEGGCHQVPRLPRKVPRRHRQPARPKRATRASPVPAMQNEGRYRQALHLPLCVTKSCVTKMVCVKDGYKGVCV